MEDKDKNVALKQSKNIWKKSNFKKETSEKCKKNIRFNLDIDVHSVDKDHGSSSKKDAKSSTGEPSPKKRKKEMDMPDIPNEVEREIEMQYHSKAKETKLTSRNVKTILKSVITNQYVVDLVRAVEGGGVSDLPFEPKLTRAKTKELLQQCPDAPVPPVVGLLTPVKPSAAELSPEVKQLIDRELSEDSSDEEYNPENEPEVSEDEEKGDVSVASDMDSLPPTPASSQAPPTPVHETSFDLSQDGLFKIPQENVGQRTRSKLDFHDLPLESIEQAYVPPDITADMYETECDNPDWHDFLKEFTQPLTANETLDDDPENDPEYNILEDEEKDPVDYKEEMRKDKAVKVSKKELNALMKELFETDTLSSDDEIRTSESIAELEASIMKETEDRVRREEEERRKKQVGFHPNQRLLLAQQMRQHVQLTTQHFLQTYRHPEHHRHADTCKTMLLTLSGLRKDKICCQETYNLDAALDTVTKWEKVRDNSESGASINKFVAEQMKAEVTQKKNKKKMVQRFPTEMMSLMMESEVFLYPMLLPPAPFSTNKRPTRIGPNFFTSSEDMLLAICLEQVTQLMEENKKIYKKRSLVDICRVITDICIPRSSAHNIACHIRKLKGSKTMNPVRAYFELGKIPIICHYVIPVFPGKKLCEQPPQKLPEVWRNFLFIAYKREEEKLEKETDKPVNTRRKPSTNIKTQKKDKAEGVEKEKPKPQKKANSNTKNKVVEEQLANKTNNKLFKSKEVISKPLRKETISSIIRKTSVVNSSYDSYVKPKTSKKELHNMLAKANSIQSALKFNGRVSFGNNESKNNIDKASELNNAKPKANNQISPKNSKKAKGKESTKSANKINQSKTHLKKLSNEQPTNLASGGPQKVETKVVDRLVQKKLFKSNPCTAKKKVQNSNLQSPDIVPSQTAAPKLKFKVVSKATPYSMKSENKKVQKCLLGRKHFGTNIQDLNNVQQQPTTLECQGNDLHGTFPSTEFQGSNTLETISSVEFQGNNACGTSSSTEFQQSNAKETCSLTKFQESNALGTDFSTVPGIRVSHSNSTNQLGHQILSESDSHQSNSIESTRVPVSVNMEPCFGTESHKPRPPSTVKLKDRLNSGFNFGLCNGKTKVPYT